MGNLFASSRSSADVTTPVISIIIPHLNQPDFLARCLASLDPQISSLGNTEVLVVDNGSAKLPTQTTSPFSWVRLVQEKTPGPGPARNHGIAVSSAPLLAFIDADCLSHPDWLSTILTEFLHNPATLIVGGDVRIALGNPAKPTALEAYESVFAYRQKEYIEKVGFSGTGNLAMRRSAYDAVGPFAGILVAEDRDWGRRAQKQGLHIKYLSNMIVYHPARKSFDELCRKWDRHVSHDYQELPKGAVGKLKWVGLAAAIVFSSILDVRKVLASQRINTFRERRLASWILFRIRLYRASRMAAQLSKADHLSKNWNRS
jgi:GT2 family glycosyltransferase